MKSGAHAVISLVVAGLALALTDPPFAAPVVVGVALAIGVGVDLDHFVLAWWRTGGSTLSAGVSVTRGSSSSTRTPFSRTATSARSTAS